MSRLYDGYENPAKVGCEEAEEQVSEYCVVSHLYDGYENPAKVGCEEAEEEVGEDCVLSHLMMAMRIQQRLDVRRLRKRLVSTVWCLTC